MDKSLAYIYDFLTADLLRILVLGSFIGAVLTVPVTWFFSWWCYREWPKT